MACPLFAPSRRLEVDNPPARAPLGALHDGLCLALEQGPAAPLPLSLGSACNFGYGRGACPRFPVSLELDGYRFSVAAASEQEMEVVYVGERDCSPVRWGRVTVRLDAGEGVGEPTAEEALVAQARCFAGEYRRRQDNPLDRQRNLFDDEP